VVPDRPLRELERARELRRARRTLFEEPDDLRAQVVCQRPELDGILDDQDVLEVVVRVTVDRSETYGKSRPLVNL
jgi:hypothetical protein